MSTISKRQPPSTSEPNLVQQLLAEKRALMVANERMRIETADMAARVGKPDPRLRRLEDENRRLREELAAARHDRDDLRAALESAVDRLQRG